MQNRERPRKKDRIHARCFKLNPNTVECGWREPGMFLNTNWLMWVADMSRTSPQRSKQTTTAILEPKIPLAIPVFCIEITACLANVVCHRTNFESEECLLLILSAFAKSVCKKSWRRRHKLIILFFFKKGSACRTLLRFQHRHWLLCNLALPAVFRWQCRLWVIFHSVGDSLGFRPFSMRSSVNLTKSCGSETQRIPHWVKNYPQPTLSSEHSR